MQNQSMLGAPITKNQSEIRNETFPRILISREGFCCAWAMKRFCFNSDFHINWEEMTLLTSLFHRQLVPSSLRRGEYRIKQHLVNKCPSKYVNFVSAKRELNVNCTLISFTIFRFSCRFCARHVQLRERRWTSRSKARGKCLDLKHYTSSILPRNHTAFR